MIERIEAAQPGSKKLLAVRLVEEFWRKDPDALREVAPPLAAALEHQLFQQADIISRSWRIFDPRVRAALETDAADIARPAPVAASHRREAKRQAVRVALWELERGTWPDVELETALRWSDLQDFSRLRKLAITLAEQSCIGGALAPDETEQVADEEELSQLAITQGSVDLANAAAYLADPETLLLAQEDKARRDRMLTQAREVVREARLSEPETDAFIVDLLEIPLAEWARETGRAPSTARSFWSRAQVKLERAKRAAGVMKVAV